MTTHYENRCQVKGCPEPNSDYWHRCFICGRPIIEHQHWPKRSKAGKGAKIVAALCPKHHQRIDQGLWTNGVHEQDGRWYYWVLDEHGQTVMQTTPDGERVTQREIKDPGFSASVPVKRIPTVATGMALSGEPRGRTPAPSEERTPVRPPGVHYTPTGVTLPDTLSFDEWRRVGVTLAGMHEGCRWGLGDWLRYGEARYGEKYSQHMSDLRFSYSSLSKMVWVAGQFDTSRRRQNLPWSFHEAVAPLEPPKQEEFLDRAQHEGLTREQLRDLVREERGDTIKDECLESETGHEYHLVCIHCGKRKGQ